MCGITAKARWHHGCLDFRWLALDRKCFFLSGAFSFVRKKCRKFTGKNSFRAEHKADEKENRKGAFMKQTTLEETKQLNASGNFRRLPVYREIFSDIRTPVETLKILKGVSTHCFLLESMEDRERWGRYTFLGYDPSMELTCMDGRMTMKVRLGSGSPASGERNVCGKFLPDKNLGNRSAPERGTQDSGREQKSESRRTSHIHRRSRRLFCL